MQLLPHPVHDGLQAASAGVLVAQLDLFGCGGGIRLLQVHCGLWCKLRLLS